MLGQHTMHQKPAKETSTQLQLFVEYYKDLKLLVTEYRRLPKEFSFDLEAKGKYNYKKCSDYALTKNMTTKDFV